MSKTTMPLYDAFLAAAIAVETQPERYTFSTCELSGPKCGSPMCAIGWVLAYEGSTFEQLTKRGELECWHDDDVPRVLGVQDDEFYNRMDTVQGKKDWGDRGHWNQDSDACADTLRKYAQTYHPPKAE